MPDKLKEKCFFIRYQEAGISPRRRLYEPEAGITC
jgi:hypothetical protein